MVAQAAQARSSEKGGPLTWYNGASSDLRHLDLQDLQRVRVLQGALQSDSHAGF